MDRPTALALLGAQCSATTYPLLSAAELDVLLDAEAGTAIWQAGHAYSYGDVVAPSVRNGHLYRCIVAGTSDVTEPAWPLYTAPDDHVGRTQPFWHGGLGPYPGSQVADGPALIWIEAGRDPGVDFSRAQVKRATRNAWLQKAAKASPDYDTTLNRKTYARSQVYAHCLQMAEKFRFMGLI